MMSLFVPAHLRIKLVCAACFAALALSACGGGDSSSTAAAPVATQPKNIILMISDGASWNTWEMAAHWRNGGKANDLPAYKDMPVRLGMTTFPLNTATSPTNNATAMVSYDAAKAWDTTIGTADTDSYATAIAGYKYLKQNYTDSAAAGTALASGTKTYNNAINYDNFGKPVTHITELARQQGKATGVVSSVQVSHATPAAFSAKILSRNDLPAIAKQQLRDGVVDLLMAPGNPGYDVNGTNLSTLDATACAANSYCVKPYDTIAAAEWSELKAGTLKPAGANEPWMLIETKSAFEALANGKLSTTAPLVGIPQVRTTLQQARADSVLGADSTQPSGVKMISSVPDLTTMSKGALNYLGKKSSKGFFLMIEGGAVDWAAHANQTGRMIEEQIDFDRSVEAVKAWVEANSNWNETLLIITTDHGNALPLGTDSASNAFSPVANKGAGVLPGVRYWTGNHTNEVVRLWARGAGSDALSGQIKGKDAKFASTVGHNSDGSYVDNTDVFVVMKKALGL